MRCFAQKFQPQSSWEKSDASCDGDRGAAAPATEKHSSDEDASGQAFSAAAERNENASKQHDEIGLRGFRNSLFLKARLDRRPSEAAAQIFKPRAILSEAADGEIASKNTAESDADRADD